MTNIEIIEQSGAPEELRERHRRAAYRAISTKDSSRILVENHPQIAAHTFSELLPVYADYLLGKGVDEQGVTTLALKMLLDYSGGSEMQRGLILNGLSTVYSLTMQESPKRLAIDGLQGNNPGQNMITGEVYQITHD